MKGRHIPGRSLLIFVKMVNELRSSWTYIHNFHNCHRFSYWIMLGRLRNKKKTYNMTDVFLAFYSCVSACIASMLVQKISWLPGHFPIHSQYSWKMVINSCSCKWRNQVLLPCQDLRPPTLLLPFHPFQECKQRAKNAFSLLSHSSCGSLLKF